MAVELDVCERQERLSSRSIHHSVHHSACHDAHDCAAERGGREHRLIRAGAGRDETRAGGGGEGRGRRGAPLVRCGIREWIGVLSPSEAAAIGVPFGHTPPGGPCSVHLHDGPSKDSRVPPTEERAQERSGACIAHVISRVPSVPNTACVQGRCAPALGAVAGVSRALCRANVRAPPVAQRNESGQHSLRASRACGTRMKASVRDEPKKATRSGC